MAYFHNQNNKIFKKLMGGHLPETKMRKTWNDGNSKENRHVEF